MPKFRKKPVVIEAVQLRWDNWSEMCDHIEGQGFMGKHLDGDRIGLEIPTLEGTMLAEQNDWVIKGVKGEFYPCKPDIFEATYEEVL
jgi:hypothetical protein